VLTWAVALRGERCDTACRGRASVDRGWGGPVVLTQWTGTCTQGLGTSTQSGERRGRCYEEGQVWRRSTWRARTSAQGWGHGTGGAVGATESEGRGNQPLCSHLGQRRGWLWWHGGKRDHQPACICSEGGGWGTRNLCLALGVRKGDSGNFMSLKMLLMISV
jgi:hypothetical protein